MRLSTIVSAVVIAILGVSAAPAPSDQLETRTLGLLEAAIYTATTTVENILFYPSCKGKGIAAYPGYAVYRGWDNSAPNIGQLNVGGPNPGESLTVCQAQCNNIGICTGTVFNSHVCLPKNAIYELLRFRPNAATVLALKGSCAGQFKTGTIPPAMNQACCWS